MTAASITFPLQCAISAVRQVVLVLLSIALSLASAGEIANDWVNDKVLRKIGATKATVKVTSEYSLEALSSTSSYYVAVAADDLQHVAIITAEVDGKAVAAPTIDASKGTSEYGFYKVNVGTVSKGSSLKLKVKLTLSHILEPFPEAIKQGESQYVLLYRNVYVPSAYLTRTQNTQVKLSSTKIESYSEEPPVSQNGDVIKYGPYSDIKPFTYSKMRIHFLNHAAFATFTKAERDIEISHWGNIAFEEVYDLVHSGAKISGGFSRLEFSQRRGVEGNHFRQLSAVFPASSDDFYYRDIIGNISTSQLKRRIDSNAVDFDMRFPLFGGWKTQFYIGYSVPLPEHLSREGDNYRLEVPFNVPFNNVVTDELQVQVILPEGATDIKVNAKELDLDGPQMDVRYTFLDSKLAGRPVVRLTKKNVVAEHTGKIVLTYTFDSALMIREPLMLAGAFFSFFLFAIVSFRVKLSLTASPAASVADAKKTN